MSILIEKALALIDNLEIRRAREIDESVLRSMTGPIIDGQEQKQIKDCFTSKDYLEDDKKGHLSSFIVMSPTNIPLIFFSLRCGELFQVAQPEKMGSVLKPSCKSILLSTQFHKYLLPLHHEESPIITLHLSRCTCRLL